MPTRSVFRIADQHKRYDTVPAPSRDKGVTRHMDYVNNKGESIGSLTVAISNDKNVSINCLNDVTTVTVRDRNTGKVCSETFFGDSPFGK
jgi:hypothetical protein